MVIIILFVIVCWLFVFVCLLVGVVVCWLLFAVVLLFVFVLPSCVVLCFVRDLCGVVCLSAVLRVRLLFVISSVAFVIYVMLCFIYHCVLSVV